MKNSLIRFLAVLTAFLTLFALCSCTVTINLAGNSTEAGTGTSVPGSDDESSPVSESGTVGETGSETSPESTSGAVTSDAAETDDATSAETSPATESTTASGTGTEPLPPESSSSVQSSGAAELTNEELRVLAEDFLNTPGINGLIQSRFSDPRACSIYDVVAQLEDPDVDASSFDALFQLYFKPYDKTKKINYVKKDNLDRLLQNATGWELERFSDYVTGKPDYFPGEFIFSVKHDSDTHRDVIVTSVSVYQDGRIEALYKAMTGTCRLFYGGDGDGFNSSTE
ncbi:MAG: hypothetical protein J6V01_08160, partial [Clostridia bacterium]|nr:hypothetical protein [Clostridia bacterium]